MKKTLCALLAAAALAGVALLIFDIIDEALTPPKDVPASFTQEEIRQRVEEQKKHWPEWRHEQYRLWKSGKVANRSDYSAVEA